MPGSRLTRQERRQIAAGLADGLGYAAIARRLGRPTSTISREVGRNGGPRGYRAGAADVASGLRARRRRTTARPAEPPGTDRYGRDPAAARAVEERLAEVMIGTGLPRTASRVLACLYVTDDGSRTAADLLRRLRVSAASISHAVGYLESLELIVRRREPGQRRERYVVDDDVWFRSWIASARTNATWADVARDGVEAFGAGTPAGERMSAMRDFFDRLYREMTGAADPAADDALTVVAALVHAGAPRTADALAAALGWPPDRLAAALAAADRPELAGPVAVVRGPAGDYTARPRPDLLTDAQRAALRGS